MSAEIKCRKCDCTNTYLKESGTNIGLYCSRCDKWIKWIPKDEVYLYKENKEKSMLEDNSLSFLGLDIIDNITKVMDITTVVSTLTMTQNEKTAYTIGITDTLKHLEALLNGQSNVIVHISGEARLFSYDELKEYLQHQNK